MSVNGRRDKQRGKNERMSIFSRVSGETPEIALHVAEGRCEVGIETHRTWRAAGAEECPL